MKEFMSRNGIKWLVVALLLLGGGLLVSLQATGTTEQIVELTPSVASPAVGTSFNVAANYNVGDGNKSLTGVGFRVFFDDTKLTFVNNTNVFTYAKTLSDSTPRDKSGAGTYTDPDVRTNKYLGYAWADTGEIPAWPGEDQTLPLLLARLNFTVKPGAAAGVTPINIVFTSGQIGYTRTALSTTVNITVPPGTINGTVTYGGSETGSIYVGAWDNSTYTGDPKGVAMADGAGAYTIIDLAPGDYYLQSFKSISGNVPPALPDLMDPKKQVATKVTVTSGGSTAANITLQQRPTITGLTNDAVPRQTKTWNWDSSQPTNAQFRFAVDQTATWTATGAFAGTKTATQSTGDGTYYVHIQALNEDGTAGLVYNYSAILDNTKPAVSSLVLNPASPVKAGLVTFTITFSEAMNTSVAPAVTFASGAKVITGSYTNTTTWVGTYTIGTGYDGLQTISITGGQDVAGNVMLPDTARTFVIDTTKPVTTLTPAAGTYGSSQSIQMAADEAATIYYKVYQQTSDPGTAKPSSPSTYSTPVPLAAGGAGSITHYWIVFYARDTVGNEEDVRSVHYIIDTNAPVTARTFNKTLTLYGTKYYTNQTSVVVTVTSTAGYKIYYTTNGSTPTTSSPFFTTTGDFPAISAAGEYVYKFFAQDPARPELLEQVQTTTVVLDFTAPADPVVSAVTSPTKLTTQVISGTKPADTGIGFQQGPSTFVTVVPIDNSGSWSYTQNLTANVNNPIPLYAFDAAGNTSGIVTNNILSDTVKPFPSGWLPAKSATGLALNTPIVVHVQDAISGVNAASIRMTVNGTQYAPGTNLVINQTNPNDMIATFTPSAIYPANTWIPVVVNANDLAGNVMDTDSYQFQTGSAVDLNRTAIGLATGSPFTFVASGGSQPYGWAANPSAGNTLVPSGGNNLQAVFTGTATGNYTVTVTDAATATKSATVEVIAPIVIGGKPTNDAVSSGKTNQFSATGGRGTYVWEVTTGTAGGSINSSGLFTANTVTTATPVTITVYDSTWNKSSVTPISTTYSFNVYPGVTLNQTAIGLATGTPFTFTAAGGFQPYGWARNPTAGSTLVPAGDTLSAVFTGTAVGNYTVTVTDQAAGTKQATAEVIAPIVIGGKPAGDAVKSAATNQFSATGGRGTYVWEVTTGTTGGSINSSGLFTANTVTTAVPVTITVYDSTWNKSSVTPISTTYSFTVYPKVAITNKPATPPTVASGEYSALFNAGGGDGTYNWTVTDPSGTVGAPVAGASFKFKAPTTGNFAGEYTITVTDGKGFTDSFKVYVPIKLVAWKSGAIIAPVMYTGVAGYQLKALGVPDGVGATDLTVTKDNPTSGVLTVPATTTDNPFAVTPATPGGDIVTVRLTTDTNGNFKGSLRVDVLGTAQLSGTIGGIPSDLDKTKITVALLDPATKGALDPAVYGTTTFVLTSGGGGAYAFTGLAGGGIPWQAYWLQVTVDGAANVPPYVPLVTGQRILVNSAAQTQNVSLPALSKVPCELTVTLGGGYLAGDVVTYKFFLESTGELALEGVTTANVDPPGNGKFKVTLERKKYRMLITGTKYLPYEYADPLDPTKKYVEIGATEGTKSINANLTALPPTVTATHTQVNGGFTLNVQKRNFTGAYAYVAAGAGTTTYVSGDGSEATPYKYDWTPTGGGVDDGFGNTLYTVNYTFTNGGAAVLNPDGTAYTYTATYTVYASTDTEDQAKQNSGNTEAEDHWEDQKDLSGEGGTLFVILGEREFFPLLGTTFNVSLKDVTGAARDVSVVIPPIPLEYLYIDDFDGGANALGYTDLKKKGGTDRYNTLKDAGTHVTETDILRVKVEYITVGGGTLSNGVSISFETRDGVRVRYNPLLKATAGGSWVRDNNAPAISVPLLLNPNAVLFKALKKLSDAQGKMVTLVSELGDGNDGFKQESLPFTVQDDGLVWVDVKHLSSVTLGTPGASGSSGGTATSGCFIATAAYGSYFEKHVQILRDFRDVYLMTNDWGRAFVNFYYRHSPAIANVIARHEGLRAAVRLGLAPFVGVAWVTINTTPLQKVLILFALIGFLTVGTVMILRFRKVRRIIG